MRIRPMKLIAATGVSALFVLGAAAPAFATAPAVASTESAAKPVKITIKGFAFKPGKVTAKVGQKIVVTKKDSTPHTVTADKGGAFDTKAIKAGGSKTFTVKKAGTYPFHCDIHE